MQENSTTVCKVLGFQPRARPFRTTQKYKYNKFAKLIGRQKSCNRFSTRKRQQKQQNKPFKTLY